MQYVHNNLKLGAEKAAAIIADDEPTQHSVRLLYIVLHVKEIMHHLSHYIRYIDYYSLKRVSKNLPTHILGRFYKLDSIVDIKLKGKNLLDVADETKTVISGSFILGLLFSTPYQLIKFEKSDIDLYSHGIDVTHCPTCMSESVCDIISLISTYLCNGLSCISNNITKDYDPEFHEIIRSTHCDVSDISFNDIIVSNNICLHDFIKQDFDFDFLKNYYSGGKLYISYPESVIKKMCAFRLKYVPIGQSGYNKWTEGKRYRQMCTFSGRYDKYTKRGFNITLEITKTDKYELVKAYSRCDTVYGIELYGKLDRLQSATLVD
jgi:hypothetical protein